MFIPYMYNEYLDILRSSVGDWGIDTSTLILRRSSDNDIQEFSPIDLGLNTNGILAWSGEDSVYVKQIYDESGKDNHLVQTNSSKQPRLVDVGTFEIDSDDNYAMYCDGVGDFLKNPNNVFVTGAGKDMSIFCRWETQDITKRQTIAGTELISKQQVLESGDFAHLTSADGTTWQINNIVTGVLADTVYTTCATYNGLTNDANVYIDNVLEESVSTYTGLGTNVQPFNIGAKGDSGEFFEGYISRVIVFNKSLTQQQATYLSNNV